MLNMITMGLSPRVRQHFKFVHLSYKFTGKERDTESDLDYSGVACPHFPHTNNTQPATACLRGELCRCHVVQAAMGPPFVVIAAPSGDDPPGFEQVLEPADAKALLAQLAVETLHIGILRGLAWGFVDRRTWNFSRSGPFGVLCRSLVFPGRITPASR